MRKVASILVVIVLFWVSSYVVEASAWSIWQNGAIGFNNGTSLNNGWWPSLPDFGFGGGSLPSQPQPPEDPSKPEPPVDPGQPLQPLPNKVTPPSSSLTNLEQQLINLVNNERAAHGLNKLQVDMTLVQLAKDKSYDMAQTGEVVHYSRTKFHSMLDAAGVNYLQAGENIAKAISVTRVHNGLMNSSGHRANILASSYTHIGVGIVQYGTMYYATQIFIRR